MYFTQEDYKKIEEWLKSKSIRDTEFNDANIPLEGSEYITLIQNKNNKKISIGDFIQQLFILGISDFLNISARYNKDRLSLAGAIRLVPFTLRKTGQVITFCNEDGNWKIYQYTGESLSTWEDTTLWNDIIQAVAIATNIVPDEEDVTSVPKGDATVIKFKNKLYNPDEYSGLGRIYLRKNMQNIGTEDSPKMVNLLTQSMFSYTNSIYIIQYDYDLNNQTISIPEGCVLKFEGGIFRNGVLNDANIFSDKSSMIFDNVIVNSDNVYITWFDSAENIKKDATNAFKSAIRKSSQSFYKTVYVPKGDYNISDTLECMNVAIIGDSKYRENVKIIFNTSSDIPLFHVKDRSGTVTSELILMNLYMAGYYISPLERTGICVLNDETAPTFRLKIVNCNIRRFSVGIKAYCLIDSIIKDTYIGYNYDGLITYKPASNIGTSTTFDHCYIQSNLRHVTIEADSMLDLRFTNGTILEGARNYVIHVKGGISFLLIDNCYFEANSYGYDWNGNIQDDEDVKQNILWVEADNSDVNSRYYTYVISNSFVSGSNNWDKLGKVITANAGVFQITNNVFARFSEIFDLVSGYTARPTKFSITFNSAYYGGSAASLFTEESLDLLHNTLDDLDINYYSPDKAFYSNPSNIRFNSSSMVEDGIENAPGVAGIINNINIKKSGQCIASFNTAGVTIIGNTGARGSAQANAQSNSLCLLNGTDLTARINQSRDDKLHSYIQSMVHSLQTRLMTYVYRSDTGVFERKYLMDFKDISSTKLADKSPSLYRYIIYYLTDKSTLAISNGTNWVDFLGNPVLVQSSGTFAQKPQSASGIKVGFSYFCTDKQTEEGQTNGIMIYHKGDDVWVDSLGREVN